MNSLGKIVLIIALLVCSKPTLAQVRIPGRGGTAPSSGGTFALVQFKFFDTNGAGTGGNSCRAAGIGSGSGSVCTVNVEPVGAGHTLIAVGFSGNLTVRTLSSVSGETWTHCAGANGCSFGSIGGTAFLFQDLRGIWLDASYVLSATGGEETLTCTLSGTSAGYIACGIYEYSYSGASVSFDTSNGTTDFSCTTCAGIALTLSGSRHLIVQAAVPIKPLSAISGSYTNPAKFYDGVGNAGWVNATDGTAPNWTGSPAGLVTVMAIAFVGN
jgi:hypothetical protein